MKQAIKPLLWVAGIIGALTLFTASDMHRENSDSSEQKSQFSEQYHIQMPPVPDSLMFCGELAPIENWDILERLERELLVNTYWQSNMMLMLKRSGRYFPTISEILKEEGVPDDFKYLAVAESGLTNAVSSAGARGMWQFMKSTATSYGLTVTSEIDERYHIEKATRAACAYLKKAKDELGSWTLAAAAYNRGLPGIKRDLDAQKVENYYDLHLNSETSRYVFRLLAIKLIMNTPQNYGFDLNRKDYYEPVNTNTVTVDSSLWNLAEFAKEQGTTYKTLKLLNPWLRDDHLTVKPGDSFEIKLP